MDTIAINLAIALIKSVIKNAEKRMKVRAIMLKLRDAIDAAYADE
ncbi:MAG TPA: hypothetical protein VNL38_01595 [Candidatus Nitrosotenuis sp.]|nr:hypothetical protein [Candidatus Nitrosotenuis sp.]